GKGKNTEICFYAARGNASVKGNSAGIAASNRININRIDGSGDEVVQSGGEQKRATNSGSREVMAGLKEQVNLHEESTGDGEERGGLRQNLTGELIDRGIVAQQAAR